MTLVNSNILKCAKYELIVQIPFSKVTEKWEDKCSCCITLDKWSMFEGFDSTEFNALFTVRL